MFDGGDGTDQGRLARGIDRVHAGVGGHQVFGRGQGHVLDILTVDRVQDFDRHARRFDRLDKSVDTLVLNERVQIVDPDESLIIAVRNLGVDGNDRDAGGDGLGNRRLDTVDVDCDQNDRVDPLAGIGLHRVVLRRGYVVGVEDDQIDAGCLRRGGAG